MVEGMWSVRKREQNAEKIAEAGAKLYDKLEMFVASFENVRKGLATANKALDEAWDHLSSKRGNALKLAKDMRDMGLRTKGKTRIVELVSAQDALPLADDSAADADEDAPGS
eukprot:TRINITY_DN26190_c0_g1_i1.p3 TRINITY_DN26190_c0_g1~~TRINITY_DN26190_c0_g1_i1.p3  ORF type:complete len:112 (+),score=35.34 TRINITY_DN26190_c0_g1_i1:113-448(+)